MFAKNRRISILTFLIAPFLMFGDANGFTELPASATTFPAAAPTTTTLASSNAPATITNIVDIDYGEVLNETTIPPLKQENDEVTSVASKTFENTASDVHKTAPSSIATKSFSVGDDGDDDEEKDMSTERKNMENEGNGNAVKTQIKYAKEQTEVKTATTTTKSALNRNVDEVDLVGVPQVKLTQEGTTTNAVETKTVEINEESSRQSATEDTRTERPPSYTSTTTTATTSMPHSAVHVERQLKNGLYRIKLAEIVTDEFNGSGIDTAEEARIATALNITAIAPAAVAIEGTTYLQHQQQQQQQQQTAAAVKNAGGKTKINIVDLYPMKIEDFNPIIRDSNAKLLKERTIFSREDADEHRQNLMPNEVEVDQDATANRVAAAVAVERSANNANVPRTLNIRSEDIAVDKSQSLSSSSSIPDSISDFTGKLLAEQDGVITEIEQKFRLNEFVVTDASAAAKAKPTLIPALGSAQTTVTATVSVGGGARQRFNVNHKTLAGYDFIDRRVKKSFDFPMHRAASDAISIPHVDFANTKFNTDSSSLGNKDGSSSASGDKLSAVATHPEFSTTKFYNSKELYSEMLQQNRQKLQQQQLLMVPKTSAKSMTTTTSTNVPTIAASASSRFKGLSKQKFQVSSEIKDSIDSSDLDLTSAAATVEPITETPTRLATVESTISQSPHQSPPAPSSLLVETTARQPKKYQKELKRAKLLLKTLLPVTTTTTRTPTPALAIATNMKQIYTIAPLALTEISARTVATTTMPLATAATATTVGNILSTTATAVATNRSTTSAIVALSDTTVASLPQERRATNPTKSSSKPIARPRILSRLQEKINSLECEIQSVPQDSNLWRGNETHELMLPIVSPEVCNVDADECSPMVVSWEGEAEIQSGDVLIVEINDTQLIANDKNKTNSAHTTQVYQVTRSGHEHCDVTEGILLDITPLVVDGRKLVTLYDKDLTEGVNLLIVVSELWGAQCVRLKVTTKTDNCGENADCSGKGVCLSNSGMEEYECQCCSGFAGPHCEEIDACTPSPCTNNGICVDLSQGHEGNSYQCLCPYGYTGKNCQYEADPCNPAECMNGGSCVGNSTHFRCDCTPGYTGPLCQHSLNECESSPCVHGICVDQEDGFRCFCQPGFAGELCNFEYNECESNPCQNGNECIDHIGRYECRCTKGYTGSRCQFKVDLCENRPCPEGHRCIDHGNDFSCECPGGQNGPDCNQMTRTQCNVNPCTHGGTCWSSGDSFYCACRPGYTGTMCEDEFVVETVISSSEFMVDDTSARNFNEKTFGSSVVLKSPIELHNAYFAAGVLAAAIFIVAIVVTICHCKVNQTYRKFSTRSTTFFPILGFGRRPKSQNKLNKHWLSGKGLGNGNPLRSSSTRGHIPATNGNQYTTTGSTALQQQQQQQQQQQHQTGQAGQLHERPFQRHLAMNLENDMYYTVDFSENSQHSPLIQ